MSARAYEEGKEAFYAGERPGANPHRAGSNDYLCWINGHAAAIAEDIKVRAIPEGKACFSYELTSSTGYNASGSCPAITTDQYTRILMILEEKG
jgi:hypothetical protein